MHPGPVYPFQLARQHARCRVVTDVSRCVRPRTGRGCRRGPHACLVVRGELVIQLARPAACEAAHDVRGHTGYACERDATAEHNSEPGPFAADQDLRNEIVDDSGEHATATALRDLTERD